MKKINSVNILRGISTLDIRKRNFFIILFLTIISCLSNTVYGGHSILDLVDPSFNPQITTNFFVSKQVFSVAALPDGKILALGNFNSFNRLPVGKLIRLNANGTLDTSFYNTQIVTFTQTGNLNKGIVLQADGKILIYGENITLNGQSQPAGNIVRLNADGTVDTGFNYTIPGNIKTTEVDSSGRVYVAGGLTVTEDGNTLSRYIIRLNADGSHDTAFRFSPGVSPFYVKVGVQNNRAVALVAANNSVQIYRLNEDGTTDGSFTPTQVPNTLNVNILTQPDNKLLILTFQTVLRLNENGGNDAGFQPPTFTTISDPAFHLTNDGKIFLKTGPNGAAVIRRFLPNGTNDSSFTQYTHNGFLSFTTQPNGSLIIGDERQGGSGTNVANLFMRLLPDGTPDSTFNAGGIGFQNAQPGNVRSIGIQADGKILIGGKFDEVNSAANYKIARLNTDSTLDPTFQINTNPTGNYFSRITDIYNVRNQSDGKIIVTGDFTYILDGATKLNMVRLNADGSIDTTFNLNITIQQFFAANLAGTNKFVITNDGKTVVGNSRIFQGLLPVGLTSGGLRDTSFNPTIYASQNLVYIYDIALQPDGKIIIGGRVELNNTPTSFVARLNADGTTDTTFQINEETNREISAIALLANGKILIAKGSRNAALPILPSLVLRLNSDGSLDNSFNAGTGANARINTMLALPTGKIFVGGKFTSFNGQPRQNLAQLNADGNLVSTSYTLNDEVLCLAVDSTGRLLIGGGFTTINAGGGGANRSYIARLVDSTFVAERTPFDFDGDGRADLGVFETGNRTWSIFKSQNNQIFSMPFGLSTDKIAPADFDGDGKTDIAVYRPSEGVWYLLRSRDGFTAMRWGAAEDKPLAGDFDGDGKDDLAVWRPSTAVWYIMQSSNSQATITKFGLTGDVPIPRGDFDGDGKTDIAVWRPSEGNFYWLASGSANAFRAVRFGTNGDIPAIGDFNGDGKTDLVVYRPTEGNWYQNLSSPGGNYTFAVTRFGLGGDVPVPADYDGDGKTDIAIRRGNAWHVLNSAQGYTVQFFGNSNAQAVAALPIQ